MSLKPLLLGAAAAIAAVGAAEAADLPMTKGEAVEYVKVCSAFGEGFFYIPGTDTCLKIGGEIRADYRVFGGDSGYRLVNINNVLQLRSAKFSRNDDRSAFNTQGRIWFDARTETDWGLLRSYFQINADSHPISSQGRGGVYNGNRFSVDKAFIQLGGLTAGYAHSFFGFYDNDFGNTIWAPYYAESNTVNLLAYTAEFGGGFKATLSIEDGRDHRVDNWIGTALLQAVASQPGAAPVSIGRYQGGQQIPDVVAQLRFDQDWGSLAVQGALHQLRTATETTLTAGGTTQTLAIAHDDKWGYAVGGSALIKLPFIDGGHFVVEGQYAKGALDYLGAGNAFFGTSAGDLFPNAATGQVVTGNGTAKGWSIVAELGGNITPVLNANLVGSYIDMKSDRVLAQFDYSAKEYTIAGNLTYTIVKGLTVSGEVAYTHSKVELDGLTPNQPQHLAANANAWQTGIRLKRKF
ncbi:porin [Labrys sp. KNU-23]|uniref:porin n=1 Tax=Labrys sp. KNU-23 TaxID=2789216 RepID=UPI0011EEAF5B|nr:porin [Labrys sp. KNU-23]QEN88007.1 porin [Labrys sp. KNU-23]